MALSDFPFPRRPLNSRAKQQSGSDVFWSLAGPDSEFSLRGRGLFKPFFGPRFGPRSHGTHGKCPALSLRPLPSYVLFVCVVCLGLRCSSVPLYHCSQQTAALRCLAHAFTIILPGRCHSLWMGLKRIPRMTPCPLDASRGKQIGPQWQEVRVIDWPGAWLAFCWWYHLLTRFGAARCVLLQASMPTASFLPASTGSFQTENVHCQWPPSGSQGLGPCRVDRMSSRDGSRDGKSGLSSPLSGLLRNNASTSRLPFRGGGSCVRLALSRRRFDFTSAHGLVLCQGYQRLEVGSGGFLSLASGFDAGGILSQGWCSACDWQCSPSFVRIDARGLNFTRIHVLGRASESKRVWGRIGELSSAGVPPGFPKSSTCTSDSFWRSGRRSEVRHSVAVPLHATNSRVRG